MQEGDQTMGNRIENSSVMCNYLWDEDKICNM